MLKDIKLQTEYYANYELNYPDPRGWNAEFAALFLAIAGFIIAWFLPTSQHSTGKFDFAVEKIGLVLWFGLVLIISEVLRRLCLFYEECNQLKTRYGGNRLQLIREFGFGSGTTALILYVIFALAICILAEEKIIEEITFHLDQAFALGALYLLFYLIFKIHHNKVEWNVALEKNPISIGQGLAYSYYYGFLRIIIPPGHTDDGLVKSFTERVVDYEERVLKKPLASKKLLIIIPVSCYCTADFESMDSESIERLSDKLEDITVSRAGMKGRRYSTFVYRIQPRVSDEPIYVAMEMPATLLTLHEMSTIDVQQGLSPSEKLNQVYSFVYVLKKILDANPDCRDRYELIFYEDRDEQGRPVRLGQVIWNRFKGKPATS